VESVHRYSLVELEKRVAKKYVPRPSRTLDLDSFLALPFAPCHRFVLYYRRTRSLFNIIFKKVSKVKRNKKTKKNLPVARDTSDASRASFDVIGCYGSGGDWRGVEVVVVALDGLRWTCFDRVMAVV
jgi:hypothetical protein